MRTAAIRERCRIDRSGKPEWKGDAQYDTSSREEELREILARRAFSFCFEPL
jgi:hypothetical protein